MHSRPQELDDEQLAELAREWGTRAAGGEQLASGVAQAFEAEQRRRQRTQESQVQPLASPEQPKQTKPRPWWKFWGS
ncbi:hypothetical protein C7T35_40065 [Variovorax sp. WS11]|nr:hypothetical protein C7T35_40065 [Variovorax sp. WS11]